jgi:hypothetical protein
LGTPGAAGGDANAAPFRRHLKAAGQRQRSNCSSRWSSFFLVADVLAYHLLVTTDRRDEVASDPEMLPHEVALALSVATGFSGRIVISLSVTDIRQG